VNAIEVDVYLSSLSLLSNEYIIGSSIPKAKPSITKNPIWGEKSRVVVLPKSALESSDSNFGLEEEKFNLVSPPIKIFPFSVCALRVEKEQNRTAEIDSVLNFVIICLYLIMKQMYMDFQA
jgi:hypothetical protein